MIPFSELIRRSGIDDSQWLNDLTLALEINPALARPVADLLAVEAHLNGNLVNPDPFGPAPSEEELAGDIPLGEVVELRD